MLETIVLGIIQGLTEFLPVSSSGHLVIVQNFYNIQSNNILLEVSLHLGTLCAVLVFFYKDLVQILQDKEYLSKVCLATLITGSIGFLGAAYLKSLFHNLLIVAIALGINGLYLLTTKKKRSNGRGISLSTACIIGLVQSIAIIPGISRSGLTISTLLHIGVNRKEAFRFSFIISIPIIIAAFFYELFSIESFSDVNIFQIGCGMIFAFLSGYFALYVLRKSLNNQKFHLFGYYCLIVSLLLIL